MYSKIYNCNKFEKMLRKNLLYSGGIGTFMSFFRQTYCDYDHYEYKKKIGKTFTKEQFFKLFPDFVPHKIISNDMTHYDHKYTIGLNILLNKNLKIINLKKRELIIINSLKK